MAATPTASADEPAPYRAAAYSRLLAWIDALPGHGWWLFPGLLVLQLLWSHGVLWVSGGLPVGTADPVIGFGAVFAPYTLAALAYLNGVARDALHAFWPATGWPEAWRAAWAHTFTTSPSGPGAWIVGAALVLTAAASWAVPSPPGGADDARLFTVLAYAPTLLLAYLAFLVAAVHTSRQLRLVARIHRQAAAIDPFDRVPVYAFSRLTMRTGLAYILVGYFALVVNGAWEASNVASLVTLPVTFGVGIAAFVLPLWGIHRRLVEEKRLLVRGSERRFDRLADAMYERIDTGAFEGAKAVTDAIQGVRSLRERIDQVPTWPWSPQVIRGFVSALVLPVVVYVVTRFISGGFGI